MEEKDVEKIVDEVDQELGGGELSLPVYPGVGNRPPRKKKLHEMPGGGGGRGGMVTSKIEPYIIYGSCLTRTPLSLMTLSLSCRPSKKDETYMYNKRYVVSSGNKANWSWPNCL